MCNSMFNFKKSVFFQSSFMFIVKLRPVYTDFSCTSCPHTCIGSLIVHIPQQSDAFVTINEFTLPYHITQGPQFILQFTLGTVLILSKDFEKCIMMCIYYCSITQSTLGVLKLLCAQPIHPCPLPTTPGNYYIFTIFIVLPFPEYHIVRIIQYIAFSNWLLSLSNMHLSLLHAFS